MSVDFERTFAPMVKDVARSVSRSFPRNVLREDTEQALWLWLVENRRSITKKVEDGGSEWIAEIASTMRKVAFSHCAKERHAIENTEGVDHHKYSEREIKTLLDDVFEYEDWQSFASFGDAQPRAKALVNTTGDRIASLVDVKLGLDKISEDHYNVIIWRYKYRFPYDEIGAALQCSPEAARQRVNRAVTALKKALGPRSQPKADEGVTGRRAVRSNAAWRAASSSYYEE